MLIKNTFNRIKSAVVLITRSYLECDVISWVDHYLNWCGFDHIYIYDNETKCCNISELFKNNNKVTVTFVPDSERVKYLQSNIYMGFLTSSNAKQYDYIAFFDDDEYLWFNKNKWQNINSFLLELKCKNILNFSIPDRHISYLSNSRPADRIKPMKDECFYSYSNINCNVAIKTITSSKITPFCSCTHFFVSNYDNENYLYNEFSEQPIHIEKNLPDYSKYCSNYIIPDISKLNLILYHYYHLSYKEIDRKLNSFSISSNIIRKNTNNYRNYNKFDFYTEYINPWN